MADVKRINIRRDAARKLAKWFNVEDKTRVDFKVVFDRTVEILEHFFENDDVDTLESFKKTWAIDEANENHEKENQ